MKNRFIFTLCFLGLAAFSFGQLPRIVLQPDGGGMPEVYQDFDDAINAAQANDRIYLSGGVFESSNQITLTFPVHLIGAGFHPDSTAATNRTTLGLSDAMIVTTAASNSTFTGIRFTTEAGDVVTIQYGTGDADDDPTGPLFERCEFDGFNNLSAVGFSDTNNSETTFNECVFRRRTTGSDFTIATFTRCIFDNQIGGGINPSGITTVDGGGLVVENCVFFGVGRINGCNGATVRNTIFSTTNVGLFQCEGATVQNCLITNEEFFGNTNSANVSNSFANAANPFVDESNQEYDFMDNLEILESSDAFEGGLDGTDMGLYGTEFPAKIGAVPFNPHFVEVEVAPSTGGDGNLPVTIVVQAQTY